MIKQYVYKIQWLLRPKQACAIMRILGERGFDKIMFRDIDLNIIRTSNDFITFSSGTVDDEEIKHIKKQIKENKDIWYVEIIKK